jgi:hypothetical protein
MSLAALTSLKMTMMIKISSLEAGDQSLGTRPVAAPTDEAVLGADGRGCLKKESPGLAPEAFAPTPRRTNNQTLGRDFAERNFQFRRLVTFLTPVTFMSRMGTTTHLKKPA